MAPRDNGSMNGTPHVLVVDDEQNFRESLNVLLGMEGFAVTEAADGEQALALVRAGLKPDAVLLDYRMPGMTGGETLRQLQALSLGAPAVLLSAAAEAAEIGSRYGFDAVLRKPVGPDELFLVLKQVIAARGA